MKKVLGASILALLVTISYSDTLRTYIPTKYSLQVRTDGLLSISALLPSTLISAKQMINSKSGVRVSVGISAGNDSSSNGFNNSGITGVTRSTTDWFSVSLHATYLRYLYSNRNLYIYYGVGPFGTYSWDEASNANSKSAWTSNSIGLDGCLGAEWFFTEHFSLFLEYNMYVVREHRRTTFLIPGSAVQTPPSDQMNYRLSYNTVFIGRSVYL